MKYDLAVRVEPSRHAAVVRDRRSWANLGAKLLPLLDRVYVAVRAGQVAQTGQKLETEVFYSLYADPPCS